MMAQAKERIYMIVIAVCIFTCLIFLVYAFIQKGVAEKAREQSEASAAEAQKLYNTLYQEVKKCEQTIHEKDSIIALINFKRK